jgi:predicted regulator of Ras-like GTPase activity (Roadblock/LC7/MglB family)
MQQENIDHTLATAAEKLPARFLLLADVTGQIISTHGHHKQMDLIALGSLVAGDLAASREIARLIGQYQANQLILREGENSHTFIVEAGHYMALFIEISQEVPLGWARMLIQRIAYQLEDIVNIPPEEQTGELIDLDLDHEEGLSELFSSVLD